MGAQCAGDHGAGCLTHARNAAWDTLTLQKLCCSALALSVTLRGLSRWQLPNILSRDGSSKLSISAGVKSSDLAVSASTTVPSAIISCTVGLDID